MRKYIYQYPEWPHFTWNEELIQAEVAKVRHLKDTIAQQMDGLGFVTKGENLLSTLTTDVIKSSEIEGELLNYDQVRSSIAIRLGIDVAGLVTPNRYIDGVVEMMLDATQNYQHEINHERLFGWHAALFPTGRSGMYKIEVACYRSGEMQIVSGAMGKERIHYQAPAAESMEMEMNQFLVWCNTDTQTDSILKAAIAHFWFIIIHPFDDGNGRIARAISDLLLARSDNSAQRFYSLSNQMLIERKNYYEVLQQTQYSRGDITEWLVWFLNCCHTALMTTQETLNEILFKSNFWEQNKNIPFNHRQQAMLNKLFD